MNLEKNLGNFSKNENQNNIYDEDWLHCGNDFEALQISFYILDSWPITPDLCHAVLWSGF